MVRVTHPMIKAARRSSAWKERFSCRLCPDCPWPGRILAQRRFPEREANRTADGAEFRRNRPVNSLSAGSFAYVRTHSHS